MALAPVRLVFRAVHQLGVIHLQQPQLLEVRIGESPAAAQVNDQPILQHPTQGSAIALLHVGFDVGDGDEVLRLQTQRLLCFLGQRLQAQLFLALGVQGCHQSRPQLQHPHEVVEVPGLQ